jgi:hypothetical protein
LGDVSDGASRLALVRAWWRRQRPPPPLGTRLDRAYMVAISLAILGPLVYGTASSALADVITPENVARWGPGLVLAALAATARWGSFDGPVVFSPPDVATLLAAPLSRVGLASRRFARALAAGAVAGAVAGAIAVVGLSGGADTTAAAAAAELVAGCALAGVLAVALAARTQCSASWSRAAAWAAWLAAPAAVAFALVSQAGATGRAAVLWSGPWGWAVEGAAGEPTGRAAAALVLLAALAAVVAVAARRGYGTCPTERHVIRAEGREGVVSSLGALDTRAARQALQATGSATRRAARGLRAPRSPALALPWRDATAALRARARTAAGILAGAGAAVLALSDPRRPAVVLIAAAGLYVAGALLLEPMRLEVDRPTTSRIIFVRPYGRILVGHAILPAVLVAVACALGAAGCALAGALPARGGELTILLVVAAPTAVLCAALSARRGGRLPVSVLAAGAAVDPSGGGALAMVWLAAWPTTAAIFGGGPLLAAARAPSVASGVQLSALVAVAAPGILAAVLAHSRPR